MGMVTVELEEIYTADLKKEIVAGLEIVSLGSLVSGLSLEAAMLGASQSRNEKLAALFYRMRLIEAYGTGISKIISCYKEFSLFDTKKQTTILASLPFIISFKLIYQ